MPTPKPKHAYLLRPVANEDARRLRARGIAVTPAESARDEYRTRCVIVVRRYLAYGCSVRDVVLDHYGGDFSTLRDLGPQLRAALREALPVALHEARAGRAYGLTEESVRAAAEAFRDEERERRARFKRARPRACAPASRAIPRGGD
ncbi:hypothetical protein B5F79_10205 [Olsenella sp. An285]|uniref:hypothetical protein n=1 Tax=Olsenella sp. An285 TaxID=1965621 RepID=UPI000B37A2D2|nr:hypothetical protein [Olsenella sp. An285]OUO45226.1 hypothetical protein B5F79_10205 [Olsenella sp. An285]